MIKKILMLSATVVSCYATDEVADSNATNVSGLPVVEQHKGGGEEIIEGGAGTYPESNLETETPKAKGSGLWCGGCGGTDNVSDPKNAPQELPVSKLSTNPVVDDKPAVDPSLQQSEIVLDVDGGKPKADETVPEKGASAPADSSKFSLFNWKTWGSKSKSKTTVDAPAQERVSILEVVNNKDKGTQVLPPVSTDLQNADGKDLDTLTDIVIADDKGGNGVNSSDAPKEDEKTE